MPNPETSNSDPSSFANVPFPQGQQGQSATDQFETWSPMVFGDGQPARWIPGSQANAALQHGGEFATKMTFQDGVNRWIPDSQKQAAIQHGGKIAPGFVASTTQDPSKTPPPPPEKGWFQRTGDAIGNNDVVREIGGDVHNMLDILTGEHPVQDLLGGVQGDPSGIKNPNAGWGSKIVANLAELLTGEGEAKAVMSAPVFAQRLAEVSKAAQTLGKYPKLMMAIKAGGEAGTQSLLQGKGAQQAAEDAATGAVAAPAVGATLEGAGNLVRKAVQKVAPRTVDVAGETIPVLANQVDREGTLTGATARETGAPEIEQAQQAGAQQAVENLAQKATRNSLDRLNLSRPQNAAAPGVPQLPAPEGAEPFQFTLEGTPTSEEDTGDLLHPARKKQIGTAYEERSNPQQFNRAQALEPYGITAESEGVPISDGLEDIPGREPKPSGETNSRGVRKVPVFQSLTESKPGSTPRQTTVSGGGNLTTTNPTEAATWLQQLDDIRNSSEYRKLPDAQRSQIDAAHKALEDQLGMYYSSPYAQRFAPVDVEGALQHVQTFGDAAAQLRAATEPVYQTLDRVSGGDFGKWRDASQAALRVIRNGTTIEGIENAETRYAEANARMNDIIDHNRGAVSQGDYQAIKAAYRDSYPLQQLHAVMERMMGGVTTEETASGLPRVFTGNVEALESFLSKDSNRADVQRVIGQDGIVNLKKLAVLMGDANSVRSTNTVLRETAKQLAMRMGHAGTGALIGGVVGHALGIGTEQGALGGALTADGMRAVLRYAATNPRIGNMVEFAATHKVDPNVYGPAIASAIAAVRGGGQQQQQEEEPQDANR
jgi:hypothetical protein